MTNKRTYCFGKSRLTLEFGDLTTSEEVVAIGVEKAPGSNIL